MLWQYFRAGVPLSNRRRTLTGRSGSIAGTVEIGFSFTTEPIDGEAAVTEAVLDSVLKLPRTVYEYRDLFFLVYQFQNFHVVEGVYVFSADEILVVDLEGEIVELFSNSGDVLVLSSDCL